MANNSLPINPRYWKDVPELVPFFGYDSLMKWPAMVELAGLDVLHDIGLIPPSDYELLTPHIRARVLEITTTEVDIIEESTQHDVRAMVQWIQQLLSPALARWVHFPFTSYDVLDTGRILMYREAYRTVVRPRIVNVIKVMADFAEKHAYLVQIGRTHLQHALPITVGFWMATILDRVLETLGKLDEAYESLVGKISGAVGAYNAQVSLGLLERCGKKGFEERVLRKLELFPARISTQILPPEQLARFLHEVVLMTSAFGQLGEDGRRLASSEIDEVIPDFEPGQVGSSTMAHKRNPIVWELVAGRAKSNRHRYAEVLDTLVTDHQRDLVDSSLYRDFPAIVINLEIQLNRLLKLGKRRKISYIERLGVNEEACKHNFEMSSNVIMAEPVYLALQMAGYRGDGHKLVNERAVPEVKKGVSSLIAALQWIARTDEDLALALNNIPPEQLKMLSDPSKYTGLAAEKTLNIVEQVRAVE